MTTTENWECITTLFGSLGWRYYEDYWFDGDPDIDSLQDSHIVYTEPDTNNVPLGLVGELKQFTIAELTTRIKERELDYTTFQEMREQLIKARTILESYLILIESGTSVSESTLTSMQSELLHQLRVALGARRDCPLCGELYEPHEGLHHCEKREE